VPRSGIETTDSAWKQLYRIGGVAALVIVAFIPIQMFVFITWPPPEAVADWFALFQRNWFLGLLSLDLMYLVSNILLGLVYLALYMALRRVNPSLMTVALALGFLGIAAYLASNMSFEMLSLSGQYAVAATEAQRAALLAAGQAILAIYEGTAFIVYYVLDGILLFIIAFVMLRSNVFSKATAYAGLVAGVLMAVPSVFGTIGRIFAIASLVPWIVFSVLIARRFFRLAREA